MFPANCASELPEESKSRFIDKPQWVKFNVGGSILETTRKTVDNLQSSFLDRLLDNKFQETTGSLLDGVYRIDRDPIVFQVFLNYGRYERIVGVPDHVTEEFILQEIAFYKMGSPIKKAVSKFFEQRRHVTNGIRVESISISEIPFKIKHKHHNSYRILGEGASISCYSGVPGGGTCFADVSALFLYKKAHSKSPALFRATCMKCGHRVCFADDGLIGLEGWCHKCHQCLRCQDILCEDIDTGFLGSSTAAQETEFIRKTATVVFMQEPIQPPPPTAVANSGSPKPRDGSTGATQNQALLGINHDKFQTEGLFKLPELPNAMESPIISNSCSRGKVVPSTSKLTEYPMSFGDYLNSGKWSS